MKYYLRPTSENKYDVGTEEWMEIVDVKRVESEYYELEVKTPASRNKYVCIDRDLPCSNLEFAKEYLGFCIISHTQFLNECVEEFPRRIK